MYCTSSTSQQDNQLGRHFLSRCEHSFYQGFLLLRHPFELRSQLISTTVHFLVLIHSSLCCMCPSPPTPFFYWEYWTDVFVNVLFIRNFTCLSVSRKCCIYLPQRLCNCIVCIVFFVFILFCQCINYMSSKVSCKWKTVKGGFQYFLDNMNSWVEFWKFVSKCIQVFTWPYVHIYENFRKVCIVIQPEMDVNKLYIVKTWAELFALKLLYAFMINNLKVKALSTG